MSMIYNNSIICVLDILGYSDLIKSKSPEELLKVITKCVSAVDEIKTNHPEYTITNNIRVQVVGDIIVFLLNLDNLPSLEEINVFARQAKNVEAYFVESFLWVIVRFVFDFISEVKYFLRGGIARGKYFQNEINIPENQFIHSQAMIDAVELEKEQAVYPRIILSEDFAKYIADNESNFMVPPRIDRGTDGLYFLDICEYLTSFSPGHAEFVLDNVRKAAESQILANKDNVSILKKYSWFASYYNLKLYSASDKYYELDFFRFYDISFPKYLSLRD